MNHSHEGLTEYLKPLPERRTVTEALTLQILGLIKEAALKPGDKLPSEKSIIMATNASRPSVREALSNLKAMGVIEKRPGSGSFLRRLDPIDTIRSEVIALALMNEEFIQIVEARRALESEVARILAVRKCTRIPEAEQLLDEMAECADASTDIYNLAAGFHLALAAEAGNSVINRLIELLYEMIREVQLEVYWPKINYREEAKSHRDLYLAVVSGDVERAVKAMRDHHDAMVAVILTDAQH